MLVILFLVLSRYRHRTFIQTSSATLPFNPHRGNGQNFFAKLLSSQINMRQRSNFCASAEKGPLPASASDSTSLITTRVKRATVKDLKSRSLATSVIMYALAVEAIEKAHGRHYL